MHAARTFPIFNEPRDYAWGIRNGISDLFGHKGSQRPEAELWLGAHPGSPSRIVGARSPANLAEWEAATDEQLPYLLKVLAAGSPLSLQAHPTREQAVAGFAREDAMGIPRDAPDRNYKDPSAKPELIVAVRDGFEALCGFRERESALQDVAALADSASDGASYRHWARLLQEADGVRASFEWLMSGDPEVKDLVSRLPAAASHRPSRFRHVLRLCEQYPGDPGTAVALLLNHVTLRPGECLWLPAGNVHAYLRGIGVELMGPSDNVLRGGLTAKHVDLPELLRILDFTPGPPPYLAAESVRPHVRRYRPSNMPSGQDVPFALTEITSGAAIDTLSPAIALSVAGTFEVRASGGRHELTPGDAVFVSRPASIEISGDGLLFVADAAPL
jgi:mannose-6-phosphate isomerase